MNQKAYSVFLCALLASSFVHDFNVKAQYAQPVSRIPSNCHWELKCRNTPRPTTLTTKAPTSPTTETPTTETQTTETPTYPTTKTPKPPTTKTPKPPSTKTPKPPTTKTPKPPTTKTPKSPPTYPPVTKAPISGGLQIFANIQFSLLITLNSTAGAAFIIDASANIIALFNAKSQSGIIINLSTSSGIYFTKKDNVIKGGNFPEYLKSLTSLQILLQIQGAIKFQVSSPPKDILNPVNEIVVSLISRLQTELKINVKVGIQVIVALGSQLVKPLKGDLNGFLKVLGTAGYSGHEDLAGLATCWQSLSVIIARFGGITALLKAGVKIDWQALANGGDGINIFAIFILSLGTKVNIATALGELLNNPPSALKLLAQLDGNSNKGVNGVLKLFHNLVGLIKKQTPIEVVINVIIQFLVVNKGTSKEVILAQWKKSINALLDALNKAKATAGLQGFVDLLIKLRDGKLVIDSVNVSVIVDHICDGLKNPNLLVVVVSVLVELKSVISIQDSSVILVLVLILNVNSPLGINLLQGLGLLLNFAVGGIVVSVGGILGFLLSQVTNLLALIFGGVLGALRAIPAIGDLIVSVQVAFSSAGVNFNSLLGSAEAKDLLKALLQVSGGLNLGASGKSIQKVQEVKKNCASVSSYLNIDVAVGVEVGA